MNPAKVERSKVRSLTDLPNIGPAMARDLEFIGILKPQHLKGKDPVELYETLCRKSKTRHDPCVLDVFISVTRFMAGEEPKPWWSYTEEREGITELKSKVGRPGRRKSSEAER
jgi:hypothetical protein